jgi:hypothetical protein
MNTVVVVCRCLSMRRLFLLLFVVLSGLSWSSRAAELTPFAGAASTPAAPWQVIGLPQQAKPFTRFSVVELDGERALRVDANESYGNLVHPLHLAQPPHHLAWRWRVDEPNPAADLHQRAGDDIAMKVCTMWDLPLEHVPFFERQVLRAARSRTDEPLPAATVCYVWDAHLAPGTVLPSPFTGRLRYMVLRSGADGTHHWQQERRDIVADFMQLFGDETHELPPLVGIAVGADSDNTHRHTVGHAAELRLEP